MSGQRFGRPTAPYNSSWTPPNYNQPPPGGPYGPPPGYRNPPPNFCPPPPGYTPGPHSGPPPANNIAHANIPLQSSNVAPPSNGNAPTAAAFPPTNAMSASGSAAPSGGPPPPPPPFGSVPPPPPNSMQVAAAAMFQAMFMQTAAMMTAATQNYPGAPPFNNFNAPFPNQPPPLPQTQPQAPFNSATGSFSQSASTPNANNSYPHPPPPPQSSSFSAESYPTPAPNATCFTTPPHGQSQAQAQRGNYTQTQTPPGETSASKPSNAAQVETEASSNSKSNSAAAGASTTPSTDRKRSWKPQTETYDSGFKRARTDDRSAANSYNRSAADSSSNRSYQRHGDSNSASRYDRSRYKERRDEPPSASAPRRFHHVDEAQLMHSTQSVFNLKEFSVAQWIRSSPAEPFFVRAVQNVAAECRRFAFSPADVSARDSGVQCSLATAKMVDLENCFEDTLIRRRERALNALPAATRELLEKHEVDKRKLYHESTRVFDEEDSTADARQRTSDDAESNASGSGAESSDSLEITDSDSDSDDADAGNKRKWSKSRDAVDRKKKNKQQKPRRRSRCDSDSDSSASRSGSRSNSQSASSASDSGESEESCSQSESDEELANLKRKINELRKKLRQSHKNEANGHDDKDPSQSERNEREEDVGTRSQGKEEKAARSKTEKKKRKSAHTTMVDRMRRMDAKVRHPLRLHPELWFNESHEMNDGPACSCSLKNRIGPMHDLYAGEEEVPMCAPESNNADRLYHYRMTITPSTNLVCRFRTTIEHDSHTFGFEGFSILSHYRLVNIPTCNMIRYNISYTLSFEEENLPDNFTVRSLDLFTDFLFRDILELYDLTWRASTATSGCRLFHILPRFCRDLANGGKELLSMDVVLQHLVDSAKPLIPDSDLARIASMSNSDWQQYIEELRGAIVMNTVKKPQAIRVDQLDRPAIAESKSSNEEKGDVKMEAKYPVFVHFTLRPLKLSIYREPEYQRLFKQFTKLNYLLKNKAKVSEKDRQHLESLRKRLEEFHTIKVRKREIAVEFESEGFIRSGLKSDVCQHALMLPVLLQHLRFHKSLDSLEAHIGYKFNDRGVLQQALTHPSFPKMNFGTNSDHAQNAITNCGVRNVEYGDKIRLFKEWRKRGLTTLIRIMSFMPTEHEARSEIYGNDRLEFLGDAVLEFIVSVHLYFMFPNMKEGWLAAYRQALVQNHHLAELAVKLGLHRYHLYVHGSDFCMMSALRHARSDVFEAFIAAMYLDANIDLPDRMFSKLLLGDEPQLYSVWVDLPVHPLQAQEPAGDRHWLERSEMLRKVVRFEDLIGVRFTHIRILARAFTMRSSGYNALTLGDNQRLEFLGDTVLKLVTSDYLFKHFPKHHEGHLSLLRSALVNRATEAIVCDELGMCDYITAAGQPIETLIEKRKADLLEAVIGALYVDQDLCIVERFCRVCFFPRLAEFIMTQEWNDPKSKLQQCCLTLRKLNQIDPDVPVYKVMDTRGPTNARTYLIGVFFRDRKLAVGKGHSIKEGEMNAATLALRQNRDLFTQLQFQNRLILKKYGYGTSLAAEEGRAKRDDAGASSAVGPEARRGHVDSKKSEKNEAAAEKSREEIANSPVAQ